jgi:hypothetical protein
VWKFCGSFSILAVLCALKIKASQAGTIVLITQRSQVQILTPLPIKIKRNGDLAVPFYFYSGWYWRKSLFTAVSRA